MRFPRPDQFVDCSPLLGPRNRGQAAADTAAAAASQVERHGFAVFRIGALRLDEHPSRDIARLLVHELRNALVAAGAPERLEVEIDRAQQTPVAADFAVRSLLPHHDGQHASYLTPSTLDVPGWTPAQRTFSDSGFTTTHVHKLYQGIFVSAPGTGLSATTYYDWLRILADVRASRGGERAGSTPEWLAANLRRCLAARETHGTAYPTLAGMLGVTEEALVTTPLLHCEDLLPQAAVRRFPLLSGLAAGCACGRCAGPVERVFCHAVMLAAGLSWPDFRNRYEIIAPSERFDLLVGNNLTMLHGGFAGGRDRVIEPLCLTLDRPEGAAYEQWLSRAWQRRDRLGSDRPASEQLVAESA
ncbi:hypothetical protein [Actinacidiphila bryophytorum]|nr:hypothetical protein [Actinacidiphila bryophytorum]MBM9438458.1 hypothetical protein [Actinacidiphila bryophytorum]MBN6542549.1 hypothetical protein [Actinacidiphila bryophytorum]